MSTAQKTKSTWSAIFATSEAFRTTSPAILPGTAVFSDQRPFTASAYLCPAELALAATSATSYQGWFSSSDTNRCPTMPVAPRTPTFSFFDMLSPERRGGTDPAARPGEGR